jgi:putative ABC transport system permease protein
VKPGKLLYLYGGWVRANRVREVLAAGGIAIGVALVFATVTANLSIGSSANRIITGLAGSAQLQATARTPNGVPAKPIVLSGVSAAANVLEVPITITHNDRQIATQIVGAGAGIVVLNPMIGNVPPTEGLMFPSSLADSLGVRRGDVVTITARGRAIRQVVQRVLGAETIGVLAESNIAFAPLSYTQRLLDVPDVISTILVRAEPGKIGVAEASLKRSLEPAMEVTNSKTDTTLLGEALKPQDQSTALFVLLGILVGVLLVVTTTMLSLADRRQELAELRLQGYAPRQLAQIVFSQGIILGAASSFIGVAGGWVLAVSVFRSNPAYLASAFPFGSQTVISIPLAIGVWVAGTLVACACVSVSLAGKRSTTMSIQRSRLSGIALVLLAGSLLALSAVPLIAALLLAGALFLMVPVWLATVVRFADGEAKWPMVAAGSIKASQLRSIGLAATAAVGVFGAVIAQGAHSDLLKGLERGYAQYVGSANVWVSAPSDDLATTPFPERGLAGQIRGVRGVTAARPYYGGWIDMGSRRVWLIARSSPQIIPAGQIVRGTASVAEQRLRQGGWIAVSDQLAHTLGVHIGDPVTIPTPRGPRRYRLAATTTNLGWSSGVLFLPSSEYVRYWPNPTPTALEIDGNPNLSVVQRIVGPGLSVQASGQRASIANALPRQGLERLSQIAWLLVIAATVAVALALCASMFQRRGQLASLRLQSFTPRQIQMILSWEAALVVGSGALLGAVAGLYGHFAADTYLRESTGYPVAWSTGFPMVLWIVFAVAIVTVVILVAPGRSAARSPLRLALEGR